MLRLFLVFHRQTTQLSKLYHEIQHSKKYFNIMKAFEISRVFAQTVEFLLKIQFLTKSALSLYKLFLNVYDLSKI